MTAEEARLVVHILEGKTKAVAVVHDARNKRYLLRRKGFRDVFISEKNYKALLAAHGPIKNVTEEVVNEEAE